MRLNGKVALITGGNSGIGLAASRLFAAEGAKVVITGRNQATLDSVQLELGMNALAMQADVTDHTAVERVISSAVDRFGKLDIVFANAGTAQYTPLGATTVDTFEQVLQVNVTSTFFLIQACLPYLHAGASIILNSSVQSVNGRPGLSAYAASKAAVRTLARVMAAELSPRSIRINVITPGAINTPIWDKAVTKGPRGTVHYSSTNCGKRYLSEGSEIQRRLLAQFYFWHRKSRPSSRPRRSS